MSSPRFKFCPNCGVSLTLTDIAGRQRPYCSACNYIDFGLYSVGVGGIIVQEKKVLLIQRNQNPGRGNWTIPGGFVEFDEDMETAVVREIKEETGLVCRVEGLIGLRNRLENGGNSTYAVFLLEAIAGDLITTPNEEIADVQFFTHDELAELQPISPFSQTLSQEAILGDLSVTPVREIESTFAGRRTIRFFG